MMCLELSWSFPCTLRPHFPRRCVHRLTDYKLNSSYDELGAWGTAMQYDETAPNIFVADFSGKIHVPPPPISLSLSVYARARALTNLRN